MIIPVQVLLAIAFTVLSHLAGDRHDQSLGAAALGVLALLVLVRPLARLSVAAFAALLIAALGIAWLHRIGGTLVPLLLVPSAFMALVAMWFARSLLDGRVPLITRIVAGLEGLPPAELAEDLRVYTRRLTLAWALVLGALALLNLVLALVAQPDGLLPQLGWPSPFSVTRTQWSWISGVGSYGVIGGFFIGEYHTRKRRFPGRYRNFADFMRRLASLGPAFWKDFLR